MATMRDSSRATWTSSNTIEHINCGSLQRIADATEKLTASYDDMRESRDRYKLFYEEEYRRTKELRLSVRSLKGVITRMKKVRS